MDSEHEATAEALMARFRRFGDTAAFDELVSRHIDRALAVASEILRDRALAEDAVQEAFLHVVRARRQYQPSKPFSAWFYTILRNVCRDLLRRHSRQARLIQEVAAGAPVSVDPPSAGGASAERLLEQLPEPERAVLTLRLVCELPLADVAAALGISYEAAKKRAQRGLQRLRERRAATRDD